MPCAQSSRIWKAVVTRVGVQLRSEAHTDPFQIVDQLLLFEIPRPVERHVLHEVGQPQLVFVFQHRTGPDDQSQLRPLAWFRVDSDVVAHSVRQRADLHGRIDREDAVRVLADLLGGAGHDGAKQRHDEKRRRDEVLIHGILLMSPAHAEGDRRSGKPGRKELDRAGFSSAP